MGQINLIKTILGNGQKKKEQYDPSRFAGLQVDPELAKVHGTGAPMQQPSEPQARPLQPLQQQQPIQQPVEAAPQTAPQGLVEQDPYESAKKDYETAVAAKPEKQPLWKQVLFMGLQAVQQIATERPQPYQLLGNAKKNYAVQQAAGRYIPLEEQRKRDVYNENIKADNEVNRERLRIYKEQQDSNRRQRALSKVVGLKRFNPNDPTHAAAAKEAGLDPADLQGWDDRNPVEKQVAGITYRLNRETNAYEPTNLPTDESKTLTNYTVEMPNGEKRTYKVAQKDAANFSTQMSALGARLAQSESQFSRRLALDEKKFTQAKTEFEQVTKMRQDAIARGDQKTAQDLLVKLTEMKRVTDESFNEGELTAEQYSGLVTIIGNLTPR